MTADPALFRFEFRAARADRSGYYYTRWDQSVPITVVAATKQAAINAADAALGDPGSGRFWTFQTKSVVDHRIPEVSR
ncbi:hypothetical protein PP502_gp53 [Gordonia phage Beenie]|uniref:Uncharacterized protein n=1 Tax=Gordonia phage Beenie TaxID=2079397 RepID=A0A2K9VHB4_9CAUD|nr:hypothetical protein PP502_gp53 [Gordonia phage Beenie]AUV61618.1 hypothetical protein PBI_BEENIE_53 [Gordonia phage Beenie]